MATNSYRKGGVLEDGKTSYEGPPSDTNSQAKVEATTGHKGKQDPFGDEENSEVKYKILRWWQVRLLMKRRIF
jgi:hypothetical protein